MSIHYLNELVVVSEYLKKKRAGLFAFGKIMNEDLSRQYTDIIDFCDKKIDDRVGEILFGK